MLENIRALSATLAMNFGYGTLKDLDDLAQSHTSGFLLFHEGYFTADLNQDGQGALEYRYKLTLDICAPSLITDAPSDKAQHLTALDSQLRAVYKHLTKLGRVSGARATLGLNLTSRNLDAIQLTCTLLPNAVSLCRY